MSSSSTSETKGDSGQPLPKNSYCYVSQGHEFHGPYHDKEYGFPIRNNDNALLERLCLEINQAGLNWLLILKKREGMREAYDQFDISKVAQYTDEDVERLRNDPRVVRNKLKIKAAIFNAQRIQELTKSHGSFEAWLDHHHPLRHDEWVTLFKKHFKFTGGEITKEFLVSLGYLPGAHCAECQVGQQIDALGPPWKKVPKDFKYQKAIDIQNDHTE